MDLHLGCKAKNCDPCIIKILVCFFYPELHFVKTPLQSMKFLFTRRHLYPKKRDLEAVYSCVTRPRKKMATKSKLTSWRSKSSLAVVRYSSLNSPSVVAQRTTCVGLTSFWYNNDLTKSKVRKSPSCLMWISGWAVSIRANTTWLYSKYSGGTGMPVSGSLSMSFSINTCFKSRLWFFGCEKYSQFNAILDSICLV